MIIKKLGHCCLLIKHNDITVLTDPGGFTTSQNDVTGIDVILITHEHADHLHIGSLQTILQNNPQAKIYTNSGVARLLQLEQIAYELLEEGQRVMVKEVEISGHGTLHGEIYHTLPRVTNTGYMIGRTIFYPGDALYNPGVPVEILALPITGPWLKLSEAIDYAREIKPTKCFPVHDGMIRSDILAVMHRMPEMILAGEGIHFVPLLEGQEIEA